jgi:hypothetical protein
MSIFVRKNVVTISTTFVASDGSTTQPSAANCVLTYKDLSGVGQQTTIPMSYNTISGAWVATWDTSAAGEGLVHWMVYGYGTLQASTQGSFEICANAANTV